MTSKLTESSIETLAIELLQKQDYNYINGYDIAPVTSTEQAEASEGSRLASENPPDGITARSSFEEVILIEKLKKAVTSINPKIPRDALDDAIKQIQRLSSNNLVANNEAFHRLLTEGINVTYQKDGNSRGDLVWLIDFNNPDNNEFTVVNQFTIVENNVNKRPDVILFINGLPLCVMELKNPAGENATIKAAFNQLQTYKQVIPSLFTYNSIMIISDGLEAKAGTITAGLSRFMAWKTSDGKVEASPLIGQLETLICGMLNKSTLLDLIRHFIVFEKSKKEDKETGVITIQTEKKLAAYHQYYAVNRAVESTLRASAYVNKNAIHNAEMVHESPESYGVVGVKSQPYGDKKGGVVWHTQGSGKSLSMVF